jgi:hydrogenase nickel incorporation protein HypA/HybF
MHELSLARSILKIVAEHVPPEQRGAVRCVRVEIGRLAGVVADSLEFCFAALVAETPWRDAHLEMNVIPLRLTCADCQRTLESDGDVFTCPRCGGSRTKVVSGMELRVLEIEVDAALSSFSPTRRQTRGGEGGRRPDEGAEPPTA